MVTHRWLQRASRRYGWRGLWLMLIGLMWVFFGVGILLQPNPPRSWVLYEYVPAAVQAAGWWLTGLVAIWQGLRGPGRDDHVGHVALYLMPAIRVLSFLLAWAISLGVTVAREVGCHPPGIGFAGGWYAALIWSLVSLMLALGAAWPNPEPLIPRPPDRALDGG